MSTSHDLPARSVLTTDASPSPSLAAAAKSSASFSSSTFHSRRARLKPTAWISWVTGSANTSVTSASGSVARVFSTALRVFKLRSSVVLEPTLDSM